MSDRRPLDLVRASVALPDVRLGRGWEGPALFALTLLWLVPTRVIASMTADRVISRAVSGPEPPPGNRASSNTTWTNSGLITPRTAVTRTRASKPATRPVSYTHLTLPTKIV